MPPLDKLLVKIPTKNLPEFFGIIFRSARKGVLIDTSIRRLGSRDIELWDQGVSHNLDELQKLRTTDFKSIMINIITRNKINTKTRSLAGALSIAGRSAEAARPHRPRRTTRNGDMNKPGLPALLA